MSCLTRKLPAGITQLMMPPLLVFMCYLCSLWAAIAALQGNALQPLFQFWFASFVSMKFMLHIVSDESLYGGKHQLANTLTSAITAGIALMTILLITARWS